MTKKRTDTALRAAFAVVVILGCAGFGLSRIKARANVRVERDYRPPTSVPRLSFLGDVVPNAINVRDFDFADDEIYLLDSAAPRIIVMHESAGHWTVARSFGRHGGGPGELLQPSGIAVHGDSVLIADRDRIHYFDNHGRYLITRAPLIPCGLLDPRVYAGSAGVYLAGRCMRSDTSTAELFFVGNDGSVHSIAHDPLFTSDGKVGSMFAASSFFSPGSNYGLFGGGTSDCIFHVVETGAVPSAERKCGLGAVRYPFIASAEFKAKAHALAAARPFAAGALTIPELLPVYSDRLVGRNGDFLLRPYSNDSISFRLASSGRDVMIAEVEGFVACRVQGCLWMRHDESPQMMFVPTSVLDGSVGSRRW